MTLSKIYRTQDAVFILGTLIRFQRTDDGMSWTRQMLSEHTGMHPERCYAALRWLINKGLVWYAQDEYGVTEDGRDYHAACVRRPLMGLAELQEWRAEALSGMTATGERSKIENAVIPRGKG